MKPELQRIETALNQLPQTQPGNSPRISATVGNSTHTDHDPPGQQHTSQKRDPSFSVAVQPFPARKNSVKTPTLPKLKPAKISEHRHAANPALAMTLLQEIQEIVGRWQNELQTTVRQVQDLYIEGPIIDGWLESHPQEAQTGVGAVRLAQGDSLMDYVKEAVEQSNDQVTCETPRTGYRLCGLDGDGQFWSRPCPPEEVASVSVAIARYQKIKQLLNRKQELETRLSQLSETLVVMHGHLSKD
jgi:hypothetical protein